MNRFSRISTALSLTLAALLVAAAPTAQAAFTTGTQGLSDNGTPTINASTLSAATVFTFGSITTTSAETGSFVGSNGQTLGAMNSSILNLATPSSFSMGSPTFGTFTASSITQLASSDQIRSFYIFGSFVSGTSFGAPTTSTASFNVSFTLNGGPSGISISDSGTLSVPAAVPEPASVAMLGLGLAGIATYAARRRRNV